MKRFAIWAVLISATAPLASARVLVEIAVADVADFEALRGGGEERFVFVDRHAYAAVADIASGVYLFRVESAVMAGAVTGKVAVLR